MTEEENEKNQENYIEKENENLNEEIKENEENKKKEDNFEYENIKKHLIEIGKEEQINEFDTNNNTLDVEFLSDPLDDNPNEDLKEFLKSNKNMFTYANPLRTRKSVYIKNDKSKEKKKSKKLAIEELVTNLKTQYILFNIKYFIRKYQIKASPIINSKSYKIIRVIRNVCLYIYGIILLFERPWFCYKGTTIPLPSSFKFIEDCEKKVEFMNIPFISNNLLRSIEILQTIIIALTQIIKYRDEYNLKRTNTGANKYYNIIQIILLASLLLCFIDLILSLSLGKFPIINFLCRPFIYIYMIKRLRLNWISILKVLWKTKKAYFFLFVNMTTFSVLGYILFKKEKGFFESFSESFLQLYILLSTCNFPDILLEAMQFSKFAIAYFFIYISINYFILLSYLKSLYTTKYYEVNKRDCLNIIRDIVDNRYNKYIYTGKKFNRFILKQRKMYSLTDDEFDNILILFNLYDKNTDAFNEISRIVQIKPEKEVILKTKFGKYILDSIVFEVVINVICIISAISLISKNLKVLIFHFIVSLLLFYEPIMLIKYLGIKRFLTHHVNRIIFHLFNISIFICVIYLYFLDKENKKVEFDKSFKYLEVFISLRTIRLFVFLDKFPMIKNIYVIIRVSKEMLYRNLLLLYSFILLFSTLSILLTGGNIKKNAFNDENDAIPGNYVYLNFNDFASSYISCFCLIMINNLNILVKSLTFQLNHKIFYQLYFATFYFFSTLILINIIQTLLLELYLNSDYSLSDKEVINDKKKDNDIDKSLLSANPFKSFDAGFTKTRK